MAPGKVYRAKDLYQYLKLDLNKTYKRHCEVKHMYIHIPDPCASPLSRLKTHPGRCVPPSASLTGESAKRLALDWREGLFRTRTMLKANTEHYIKSERRFTKDSVSLDLKSFNTMIAWDLI